MAYPKFSSPKAWLTDAFDDDTREAVEKMLSTDKSAVDEVFGKVLEFGTGGLRGIMGIGSNRMNQYTVGIATQGLANYLKRTVKDDEIKVAIAYDSRLQSDYFAGVTADVLSANDIHCYLFDALRPTPELSFAVRHLHCHAGVVITASHNPKEYNGYKVYWQDGGQIVPPHDQNIIAEVNDIFDFSEVQRERKPELISIIGEAVDAAYLEQVQTLALSPKTKSHKSLKIVYTPIHGSGIQLVPRALEAFGFKKVYIVKEQATPDGNFPTVKSPNPEEASALELAIKMADEVGADLVLATDPDADRVGIGVRDSEGKMVLLNGNQTASILMHYILSTRAKQNDLSETDFIVKTVVTTELIRKIAEDYNVECQNVLTGFKYIADRIENAPKHRRFIAGCEESYGFLSGTFVRDKDAVSTCCLVAELAATLAEKGSTIYDYLLDISLQYGFFKEQLFTLTKPSEAGIIAMNRAVQRIRRIMTGRVTGIKVVLINDFYKQETVYVQEKKRVEPLPLPRSNVLQIVLEDQTVITLRPSGTEPKLKFYFSVYEKVSNKEELCAADERLTKKIRQIYDYFITLGRR